MTQKALVVDDVAVNVVAPSALEFSFHPAVACRFESVPNNVREGWVRSNNTWSPPTLVLESAPQE